MKLKFGPYSPSRLDTANCPYSFYKQYIDPERPSHQPENLAQARGAAVHEVFELITRYHHIRQIEPSLPGITFDEAELRKWVVKAVNKHPAAYRESELIMDMCRKYLAKPPRILVADAEVELRIAVKLTTQEIEEHKEGDPEPVKKTIHVFEECEYDDPEAFARGRTDISVISDDQTEAIIYDHKTQPNMEDADTFQLGFYAWVYSKTHPYLERIKTVLHFARYGYYSEPYIWTKDDLAAIESEIMTRIQVIENKETWDAIPHSKCQYCPFVKSCPVLNELIAFDDHGNLSTARNLSLHLGGEHQAPRFAGYITVLEELLKGLKDDLRAHVALTGAVAIPGKIYDFESKEEIDWAKVNTIALKNKAYDIFSKYGIDPKSYMGFSQTFSKNIWQAENEELIKDLAELFPKKVSTEFKGRKM